MEHKITLQNWLTLDQDFKLNKDNTKVVETLFKYFTGDPSIEADGYSLKKGILLTGSIGTGKTTIFNLFKKFMNKYNYSLPKNNFKIIESRFVIRDFLIDGMKTIDTYGRKSFSTTYDPRQGEREDFNKPITICFDDLGLEEVNSSLYGNKLNVMADVLLDRYIMFESHGMITHAISNLSIDSIAKLYGDRAIDRFKSMFNDLVITGKSLRK